MVTWECNQKTLGALLIYPLTSACFPCRIFPRTSGECRKILKRHVCPDIWHAVHAKLWGVPGPLHRAEAVLHRRQCELGGNAEWFLGSAVGTDVPAYKPPVPFHRGLPGVCKQVHRPAEAVWRCTKEAEGSSDSSVHCCTDLCSGTDSGQRGCKQSIQGNLKSGGFKLEFV